MRIEVKQKHIDKGKIGMPACCPVALAMADAGLLGAFAFPIKLEWSSPLDMKRYVASLPVEVERFMANFDDGGPNHVKPFEFDLEEVYESKG